MPGDTVCGPVPLTDTSTIMILILLWLNILLKLTLLKERMRETGWEITNTVSHCSVGQVDPSWQRQLCNSLQHILTVISRRSPDITGQDTEHVSRTGRRHPGSKLNSILNFIQLVYFHLKKWNWGSNQHGNSHHIGSFLKISALEFWYGLNCFMKAFLLNISVRNTQIR